MAIATAEPTEEMTLSSAKGGPPKVGHALYASGAEWVRLCVTHFSLTPVALLKMTMSRQVFPSQATPSIGVANLGTG